jgi:hypothetical protein
VIVVSAAVRLSSSGGGSDGQGVGGGMYIAAGGDACIDLATIIMHNHASTSNDDVFGVFRTDC